MYKAERKKQRQVVEAAEKKTREEFKQQKELRSYSYVSLISKTTKVVVGAFLKLLTSFSLLFLIAQDAHDAG